MLKGKIHFEADVPEGTISFTEFSFPLDGPQAVEIAVACPAADRVVGWVRLDGIDTDESGSALAVACFESLLDRLAFFQGMAIEKARRKGSELEPMNPPLDGRLIAVTADLHIRTHPPTVRRTLTAVDLAPVVQFDSPGQENFALFRAARLSAGVVEEYVHLYVILLTLFGDSQREVDEFIRQIEPHVVQSLSPKTGLPETVYTRLRNELAHRRAGVELSSTKAEIRNSLAGLREVVRQAMVALL